jgi:pimeloyl-ACP methyl ester carboxylesterase
MKLRGSAFAVAIYSVLLLTSSAIPARAGDVTILVNGSFNAYPPWMDDWSSEFTAIANTYGTPPQQHRWPDSQNHNIYAPFYSGIFDGAVGLANFLDAYPLDPNDNLNIVTHSHGGNVALIALWLTSKSVRHLVNLGTPINWDFGGLRFTPGTYSRCQVSSVVDWVQFVGSSPLQVGEYGYAEFQAVYHLYLALIDLLNEYEEGYLNNIAIFLDYQVQAAFWWMSTKEEWQGPTFMYGGLEHWELHEPDVWNDIAPWCAVN